MTTIFVFKTSCQLCGKPPEAGGEGAGAAVRRRCWRRGAGSPAKCRGPGGIAVLAAAGLLLAAGAHAREAGPDGGPQPLTTPLLPAAGEPVGHDEAAAVYFFSPKRALKNNNGSFELGWGTSGVFAGYRYGYEKYSPESLDNIKHPPPRPGLVEGEAFSGTRSLLLESDNKLRQLLLYLRPPYLHPSERDKTVWLSFRIKAGKPGMRMSFRHWSLGGGTLARYINKKIPEEWKLVQLSLKWTGDAPSIRMDITPGKVWIDDIAWSVGKPVEYKLPDAEIVLDPVRDDAIVFAGEKLRFSWRFRGAAARPVETALYLRDPIRDGATRCLARRKGTLAETAARERYECPPLRRGLYLLAAVVRDARTGEILARDLMRFCVIDDLSKLPRTVDFDAGAMYLFAEPFGFTSHGMWSLDGLYRMNSRIGCRIIRLLKDWMDIEPVYGKRDWAHRDYLMEAAHKYGCGYMCEIPGVPLELRGEWKKHCHLVSKKMTGGTLKKTIGENDYIALDPKTSFWMPDVEYMKDFSREFVARYKDRGLMAVEYKNEVNAIMPAAVNVKQIMSRVYPAMKAAAPNVPVFVNSTGNGKLSYLEAMHECGGFRFMDGFSFHPYAWATLRRGSLANALSYRKRLDELSPGRRMALAQTEDLWLYEFEMQRILSDWVGGCRFSCGIPWRNYFAKEHGNYVGWHNTGPVVPGPLGVSLAGMNAVLAGARCVGCVESLADEALIGFFEKNEPGRGKRYLAALCAAYRPGRALCLENVDLSGLDCRAFDEVGEEVQPPSEGKALLLSDRVFYLSSPKRDLFGALSRPDAKWVNYAQAHVELARDALPGMAEVFTGSKSFGQYCLLDGWRTCGAAEARPHEDKGGPKTRVCRLYPGSGNVILRKTPGAPYESLRTTVWSRGNAARELAFSSFGVGSVSLFVNGKCVRKDLGIPASGRLGSDWCDIGLELADGRNEIELVLRLSSRRAAVRILLRPPREERLADLYDAEQVGSVVSRLAVPGVLLSSRMLKGGGEDPYDPSGKLYKLLVNPKLLDPVYYSTDKRHEAEIRIGFADGKAYVVNDYCFNPRFNRFPPAWRFEGSNDATNWTLLHEESHYKPKGKALFYRKRFDNRTAYKNYRFVFRAQPFLIAWKGLNLFEWTPENQAAGEKTK